MILQQQFSTVCQAYVETFFRKHGLMEDSGEYFDYDWVADETGGILTVGDYFINFDDIRRDVDESVAKGWFFKWYNYNLENETSINYKSWLKGYKLNSYDLEKVNNYQYISNLKSIINNEKETTG